MGHEIARGESQRLVCVLHAKPGQVASQGYIPPQLALVDERTHRERRECLGRRTNREQRLRCDRQMSFLIALAVAFEIHGFSIDRDAD